MKKALFFGSILFVLVTITSLLVIDWTSICDIIFACAGSIIVALSIFFEIRHDKIVSNTEVIE